MHVRPTSRPTFGGGGLGGSIPRDLLFIAGALLVTVTLSSFRTTAWIPQLLTITPDVWQRGFIWQLATYLFVESNGPSFWFLINLILLFLWGRDVFQGLGRRHFWRLLLFASIGAGVLAALVDMGMTLSGLRSTPYPFALMRNWALLAVLLAAWARAHRGATVLFMFILPIEAGWFVGLELLMAFLGLLTTRDVAGFVGVCTAIGIAWYYIGRGGRIGLGKRDMREYRLRLERWWIQQKLNRAKKKRGFRVIPGEKDPRSGRSGQGGSRDPWVH